MNIQLTAAVCICGCLFCILLRQYQRPQSLLLGLAVCGILLLAALPYIQYILDTADVLFGDSILPGSYFSILCRAVGICYLTQIGIDFCRECGELAIASAVELSGRVSLILLSLPLFTELADRIREVIL